MVGGAIAYPVATPEPDVRLSLYVMRSSSVKQVLVMRTESLYRCEYF